MGCDCGKRKVSYNEKRDCDESAKMEDQDQDQVLKFKEQTKWLIIQKKTRKAQKMHQPGTLGLKKFGPKYFY